MDGVLADVEGYCLDLYKAHYGIDLTKKDVLGKKEDELLPDGQFRKYVQEKGFFRNVILMDGAVEAIKKLSADYEVYIVSAAMEFPLSLPEKKNG